MAIALPGLPPIFLYTNGHAVRLEPEPGDKELTDLAEHYASEVAVYVFTTLAEASAAAEHVEALHSEAHVAIAAPWHGHGVLILMDCSFNGRGTITSHDRRLDFVAALQRTLADQSAHERLATLERLKDVLASAS